MKKKLLVLFVCSLFMALLTSCGNDSKKDDQKSKGNTASSNKIVDGKFVETKYITVEIFDRGNDGGSKPEDNYYTNFIKEGMLKDHNIDVTFMPVPRWTEVEQINNLLASGDAPDICVTYDYPTIQTYANMGGVTDLSSYVEDNKELLPNLWTWLGDRNINWDKDPNTGKLWCIEAKLANSTRLNTFVREDWLKVLNIEIPTNIEEFEGMLVTFKENAELLLGEDKNKMIPLSLGSDVGWRADHLIASFVPENITTKDYYINGFDDRHITQKGVKEGIRKLNEWYNKDLIWDNFALYPQGDPTEDNMVKSGYVGAFIHNWDYPYRNGDESIVSNLKRLVNENAAYIAISPFKNDAGKYRKFLSAPIDRKVFFPTSNNEPVASLMYLDWLSTLENRLYLQIGDEGDTHIKFADGSVKALAIKGEKIMNSPNNIDYTIIINGLDLGDTNLTMKSLAHAYAGIDSKYVELAYENSILDGRIEENINLGEISAETGMGPSLKVKRDIMLAQAVVAKPSNFDSVFDSAYADYMASGGQAIKLERKTKYEAAFE